MRQSFIRQRSEIAEKRIQENQCPNCGKPKQEWNRRKDWLCCSKECSENYYKEHDTSMSWGDCRTKVFKRDNGICRMCKKKFVYTSAYGFGDLPLETELIADHIIPIELGGGMWDFDNIQTLCISCNKIKTKVDMGNIAKHRRRQKKNRDFVMCSPFVSQEML